MASQLGFTAVDGQTSRIVLPPRFDLTVAKELLKKIRSIPTDHLPRRLHLDCSRTAYIDTAALGSLLLLGEYLVGKSTILVDGATGTVRGLLDMARIDERLAGRIPMTSRYDLRACTRCGQTADGRCSGTLEAAATCPNTAFRPLHFLAGTTADVPLASPAHARASVPGGRPIGPPP